MKKREVLRKLIREEINRVKSVIKENSSVDVFGLNSDDEELNQLSHRKKDFRSLFDSLTVRKEPDLENIPKYSYDELTDEQKKGTSRIARNYIS